ncbi:uncharacterized protein LOC134184962 isoform X2 [Corticium candelabrum]|uniref:uncharacterized protein LOC134184962 isoform X2 n=1 Tax=Corticium candelabrum TaxID=121492 RepID=UPI002E270576|nr:uncharacterized protein LOC134184962 isoform X2 [Corticium candelabrum]
MQYAYPIKDEEEQGRHCGTRLLISMCLSSYISAGMSTKLLLYDNDNVRKFASTTAPSRHGDGSTLSIVKSEVQCAYPIKDEEGKEKEVQEFLEFIAHQLKLNIDGSKSTIFKVSLMYRIPTSGSDLYQQVVCLRGHLFLIGCKSTILMYNSKDGQQRLLCLSSPFKLHKLTAACGRCFGMFDYNEIMSLQEYEVKSNTWHHISYLPKSAKYGTLVADEEYLCIIGGIYTDQKGHSKPLDCIQYYSFRLQMWMKPLTMSKRRHSCMAAISQSVVYIVEEDGNLEAVSLSASPRVVSQPMPLPRLPFRSPHKVFSIHRQLFALGEGSNSIYVLYQPSNKQQLIWMPLVNMPSNFQCLEACFIDDVSAALFGIEDHNPNEMAAISIYTIDWSHYN